MIALEVFGETLARAAVAERLVEIDGASRVRMGPAVGDGRSVVLAHVSHDSTDEILAELRTLRGTAKIRRKSTLGVSEPRET
jgi:hypothetical protein